GGEVVSGARRIGEEGVGGCDADEMLRGVIWPRGAVAGAKEPCKRIVRTGLQGLAEHIALGHAGGTRIITHRQGLQLWGKRWAWRSIRLVDAAEDFLDLGIDLVERIGLWQEVDALIVGNVATHAFLSIA